jgi:hypothetical protein|tara:strand:+ start:13 stop:180 length:168 start_codon:yes stop_codon:yes gene_type:complete
MPKSPKIIQIATQTGIGSHSESIIVALLDDGRVFFLADGQHERWKEIELPDFNLL